MYPYSPALLRRGRMKRQTIISVLISLIGLNCQGPTGPPGPGGESLTDPSIKPRVIYTYPENNTQGPFTGFTNRITVRFNKIMDWTTIKRAVNVSSSLGDVYVDTNSVSTQNSDVFSFVALDTRGSAFKFQWKLGQSYTLTIDSTAEDINGNLLR